VRKLFSHCEINFAGVWNVEDPQSVLTLTLTITLTIRGVRLAKNDFGSVLQKTSVFGSVSVFTRATLC